MSKQAEPGTGVASGYPLVTKVECSDREKGIYMVTFIPEEGAKEACWGLLADDELHAFQRIRQEWERRKTAKDGRGALAWCKYGLPLKYEDFTAVEWTADTKRIWMRMRLDSGAFK